MFLDENKLLFVRQGTMHIQYGNVEYTVCKEQVVFLKKNILIRYRTANLPESNKSVEYIAFSLKHEVVREFTKMVALTMRVNAAATSITVIAGNKRLLKYMDSLEPYFSEPGKVEGSLIKIKLLELLFSLINNYNLILEQLLDLREHYHSNITTTVEENLLNSLSLHQLAVLSGRSLSSFRRDFLAIYNMPPSQWIRQKKLEKAQELLTNTTMSITDICYTAGFENIAHFSRLFRSQFGYSPSEFRSSVLVA